MVGESGTGGEGSGRSVPESGPSGEGGRGVAGRGPDGHEAGGHGADGRGIGRRDAGPRARAFAPLFLATLRALPEDFVVDERFDGSHPPAPGTPDVPDGTTDGRPALDGAGEHLWLRVRKRLANTEDVAGALATGFGVPARDVGHAGMKDRRAVTTQWFSVRTTDAKDAFEPRGGVVAADGAKGVAGTWEVLEAVRHSRKLRRGAHAGNRFRLTLRDLEWLGEAAGTGGEGAVSGAIGAGATSGGPATALAARADDVRARGFPNRFGPQRFGRGGANVGRARAMFAEAAAGDAAGDAARGSNARDTDARGTDARNAGRGRSAGRRRRRGGRRRTATARGLLLSAARSAVFNAALDERVRRGDWTEALDGEPLVLAGSASFFVPDELDGAIRARLAAGDLSPSGPLPGAGAIAARGDCAGLEAALISADPELGALAAGLAAAGVDAGRRALVARVPDLELRLERDGDRDGDALVLVLAFTLGPGAYATSLLDAFGELRAVPHSVP